MFLAFSAQNALSRHSSDLHSVHMHRLNANQRCVVQIRIAILDGLELASEPGNAVGGLDGDGRLRWATPWSTAERHELPIWTLAEHPLGFELVGVFAPQVLILEHGGFVDADDVADSEVDGLLLVLSTAEGQGALFDTLAGLGDIDGEHAVR